MLCACAKKSPIVEPTITRPRASSIPTVSFSLSIYQNLIRDAHVGSHSLQRRTTFPVRATQVVGKIIGAAKSRASLGKSTNFCSLFRQNSRVPKFSLKKMVKSFFARRQHSESKRAQEYPPLKEKSGARVVKRQIERENRIE